MCLAFVEQHLMTGLYILAAGQITSIRPIYNRNIWYIMKLYVIIYRPTFFIITDYDIT